MKKEKVLKEFAIAGRVVQLKTFGGGYSVHFHGVAQFVYASYEYALKGFRILRTELYKIHGGVKNEF